MANEILKDEILQDEQLEQVAGGTYAQTFDNMNEFKRRTGFQFSGNDSQKRDQLRDILYKCGVKLKDHGGLKPNEYFIVDRQGNRRSVSERTAMDFAVQNYKSGTFIC